MHHIPAILDCELPSAAAGTSSVLTLPLGTGSVLDCLVAQLSGLDHSRILVVSDHAGLEGHAWSSRPETRSRIRPVRFEDLAQVAGGCEACDYLLLVEPRQWPADGYDFASILKDTRQYRGATHLVAVGDETAGPRERVECDATGQVRRVQRLYDAVSWPNRTSEAVFCSAVPARAVCDIAFRCLGELRTHLAEKGIFTQDLPVVCGLLDLTRPADIIALNEPVISRAVVRSDDEAFHLQSPGVLVGRDCVVHPSARIIAPVILHHGARVEEGATLVGPVVVGPRAVVAQGAMVAQSVLSADATVARQKRVCQRVVVGSAELDPGPAGIPLAAADATAMDAGSVAWESPAVSNRRADLAIKRVMDFVLAFLGLVALAPLLLVAAALVKLTSPGPVFFVHTREGRGGREFGCIKFRTMVANAHARQRELYQQNEVDGPQFKMDNDPRVTRIGAWFRRTNIDELPQLFNVLAGHMSLVGPRPSPFRENQICVPWRLARLSVRPGITGLWQICRDRRNDGDFHQWIFYDLAYVRHFSLRLDIKVLWHTLVSRGGRRHVALGRLIPAYAVVGQHTQEPPVAALPG